MSSTDIPLSARKTPSLAILVALSMVSPAGINIIAPALPELVGVFDTDYGTVQLTLSLFLAVIALAQLIIGPLSDFFGRRPVILYGMLLSVLGSAICVFAPTIEIFILGRIIQGAGACTGIALARAIIRDLYERDRAASMIGYVTMAMTIAPMIAPFLGGLLQEHVAWWGSSALMLIFSAIVLFGAYVDLHETNHYLGKRTSPKELAKNYASLLINPAFILFAGIGAFASAIYFSFMGGAPLISHALLGQSPTQYGLYFFLLAFGYGVGNFISGRYTQRFGIQIMMLSGSLLGVLSVIVMILSFKVNVESPMSLFVPMFFGSIANGLVLPSAIAGAVSVRPDIAGSASGLTGFFQIGSGALAATITAEWLDLWLSIWPLIIMMLASSLIAFFLSLIVLMHKDMFQSQEDAVT